MHGELVYGNEQRFETVRNRTQEACTAQRVESHQRDVIERIADPGLHG